MSKVTAALDPQSIHRLKPLQKGKDAPRSARVLRTSAVLPRHQHVFNMQILFDAVMAAFATVS